jgi:hypothetical protein
VSDLEKKIPLAEPEGLSTAKTINPIAIRFAEAGGFDAIESLRAACKAAGVSYACIVQLYGEDTPDEQCAVIRSHVVLDDADMSVQAAALAIKERYDDLITGLALTFGVRVDGSGGEEPSEKG